MCWQVLGVTDATDIVQMPHLPTSKATRGDILVTGQKCKLKKMFLIKWKEFMFKRGKQNEKNA